MANDLGTESKPLRVAIIGSGPSGFYAAEALLTSGQAVKVDMYDRLPAPFGLVRYGVAPDHPKIKNVIKVFERIAENPNFWFFGNVNVGEHIGIDELKVYYDAIIFACGAQTDRALGIPGEDLLGSYTATEFVAWYNGHPDYKNRKFDLSRKVAVVIGQGNVAMDVSRILCKAVDELKHTDIAQHALEALAESKVREVHLVGRRGPAQAAFTPPEIKEFGELADCDIMVNPEDLKLNPESQIELDDPSDPKRKKNFEILKGYSEKPPAGKSKKFVVHFFKGPRELKGSGHVERLVLEKNRLSGAAGKQKAEGTGELEEMDCGILFRSVGYRGVPVPRVPFDENRGTFPNQSGRITKEGAHFVPFYATGWIKRGPSGVIGTNKPDSVETVQNFLQDVPKLKACPKRSSEEIVRLLKGRKVKVVNFGDWKKIDTAEIERGKPFGKPREKFVTIEEMIGLL